MQELEQTELKITSREIIVTVVLGISLAIAIFIIIWSRTPNYRPLVQDINIVDAVKIVDVLTLEGLSYETDLQNHTIYISEEDADQARLSLARMGIALDYPKRSEFSNLPEACELLAGNQSDKEDKPIFQQYWFIQVLKVMAGMVVIVVLILGVVRPTLRAILYPDEHKEEEQSQ